MRTNSRSTMRSFASRPGREQDLVVALHELLLGRRDGLHGESQTRRAAPGRASAARGVPSPGRDRGRPSQSTTHRRIETAGIGSDREKSLERHDWQPRCRRFPVRPVALRPFLSEGVPLAVAGEHRSAVDAVVKRKPRTRVVTAIEFGRAALMSRLRRGRPAPRETIEQIATVAAFGYDLAESAAALEVAAVTICTPKRIYGQALIRAVGSLAWNLLKPERRTTGGSRGSSLADRAVAHRASR